MLSHFARAVSRIESNKTDFRYWLVSLFGLIYVRNLIEGVLEADKKILSPQLFFFSYVFIFLIIFLGVWVVLRLLTKEKSENVFKVLTVFYLLILLPPVLDFIATSGAGYRTDFVIGNADYMFHTVTTGYSESATIGQRVEGVAMGLLIIAYLAAKTKSLLKTLLGAVASYAVLYLSSIGITLIFVFSSLLFPAPLSLQYDSIGRLLPDSYGAFYSYITPEISVITFVLFIILEAFILLRLSDKRLFDVLRKMVRPLRMTHYLFVGAFGLILGHSVAGGYGYRLHDAFYSFAFLVSVAFIYHCASLTNDFFDRDFHKRSGVRHASEEFRVLKWGAIGFFLLSLLVSYRLNFQVPVILFTLGALSFLYSAPPFRLKRYPLVSSLTIAVCALLGIVAGFSVFAGDLTVELFPPQIALLVLIVYTIGTNYKDLKDIETDKADGVHTLPVLLGEKNGRAVVTLMVMASFVLVYLIMGPELLIPSIVAAFLSAVIITKKLDERYFRVMHLAYFLIAAYFIL